MMIKQAPVTVFTATYNRGHLLAKLYNSLLAQTCPPYEWIVLDDGSIDETSEIVQDFINENKLSITYLKTTNGGKHRAINKGVEIAKGELFFIVDSDDYLPEDSLERVNHYLETFSLEEKKRFAGVSGLKFFPTGKVVGDFFPIKDNSSDFSDMTYWELRHKYHIKGDKAEVYFTEILKKFPFPEFDGEFFLTEAVVWGQIALAGYPIRWFNHSIYICEYLPGGLSDRLGWLHFHNPQGSACYYNLEQLHGCDKYALPYNYNYYCYSLLSGKKLLDSFRKDNNKFWAWLGIPLGFLKKTLRQPR